MSEALKRKTAEKAAKLVYDLVLQKKSIKIVLTINNGTIKLKRVTPKKSKPPISFDLVHKVEVKSRDAIKTAMSKQTT